MSYKTPHDVRHRAPILMIAILGTALSIAGWYIVSGLEDRTSAAEFNLRAGNMAAALQNGIDEYFTKLSPLRAIFEFTSGAVSEQEFMAFSNRLLRDQSAILSLSWIPRIRNEQRAAHEQTAQREGSDGYRIRTVTEHNALEPSPAAAEYFPVYYSTEKSRVDVVKGLNLADSGIRQRPLESARDGDALAASQEFMLQSGTGDRIGFFVVLPIYKRGLPHKSVEERRQNLVGFVQGVFQIDTMIAATLRGIRTPADYYIFASEADSSARLIYTSLQKPSGEPLAASHPPEFDTPLHWSGKIDIADRQWRMVAVPKQTSILIHSRAWILLAAGLCMTGLIFVFMWRSNLHTRKLIKANKMISELASTDPLTGLANRRTFHDRLALTFENAKRGGGPFAVLYIDLDHFKDFNDLMGHPAGDALLVEVGERLLAETSDADCVARLGGDEFAILQSNAGEEGASEALAERIVATLNELTVLEGYAARISASVGVSRYAEGIDGPDVLLMQADLALYRAKDAGRNRAGFHDETFGQLACERVLLGRELVAAIKCGGLALQYQPQVDIETRRIVGLEALVRWNHPQRGSISPAVFIPVAEKTGSIVDLGKWVFDEACRQTRVWQDEGIDVPTVAVNLSAIQCKRPELELDIVASLKRWNIAPDRIELELTESVLMEATEHHRNIITRLRALGLRLAIDDFGTGYSSLNYLTNFPVDRIKIAQELIFKCTTEIRCAAVVRAAIRLAEELDTEVLAEGVENSEQARFLSSAGCKSAQGYFFSRPVDAAQAATLLRAGFIRPLVFLAAPKDGGSRLAPGRLMVV
ncbi:bifunctional diguanylate cyclase/phosphodiesterase [Bradyrhizobium sp. JYMT SZCCT0428]|uniref:putative bifunctional diguanylate cyclase/phosphodiesterase n=1 Tax=Bradyrhizobium sp. JYMT SZCCT0428 TaxID=2807673 RepID=UPI001BAE25E6|nr:EAL domain-containing protein [Bradyrhizobium sp. JYMT SZCCT0428]MBR1157126.1 EAL domain-containing protein [Bradyrhizobium sp. JYMT SZCCT0428]